MGLTVYDVSALALQSNDPAVATALTDSCHWLTTSMQGVSKICSTIQCGVAQGVRNNLDHKYILIKGLLTSPVHTLQQEYIEPLMMAGKFLGKAISKSLDLVRSANSPGEFERKARPLITMARNIAHGIYQNPEEVIALGVDLLLPSGSSIIKRFSSLVGTKRFANALHDTKEIAQRVAADGKVATELAKVAEPTKTVFEEAIKTTYAEQKTAAKVKRAAEQIERTAGEVHPSMPVNRRGGLNLDVPAGTHTRTTVYGREYSGHAIDRMRERGLTPMAIENTIKHGALIPDADSMVSKFYDKINNITVVIDKKCGRVISGHFGE